MKAKKKNNKITNVIIIIILAMIFLVLLLLISQNNTNINFDIDSPEYIFVGDDGKIIIKSNDESISATCKNANIECNKKIFNENQITIPFLGKKAGIGEIEINYKNASKRINVTICDLLNIDNPELIIGLNKSQAIKFNIDNVCLQSYTFKVDNDEIASYSNGEITGKKVGNTKLNITKNNESYSYNINVIDENNITFTTPNASIKVNEEEKYSLLIIDDNFTCNSSDEKIFETEKVEKGCKVKAINPGSATLTAKTKNSDAKMTIEVLQNVTDIIVDKEASVVIGKNITIPITIKPDNATATNIQCISENPDIITTSVNGNNCLIKGEKIGTANLIIKVEDKEATTVVTVKDDIIVASSISITNNVTKLSTGDNTKLTAKILPDDTTNKSIKWSSDNQNIVEVNQDGTVTAKKNGIVTIKAETINGKTATSTVIVTGTNMINNYDSQTLKYWIEKPATYNTISYIWVGDPYSQFKVAIAEPKNSNSPLPRKPQSASNLIDYLLKQNNYENKGLVLANASSIVSSSFNTSAPSNWYGTAAIPLIINNGQVIRDSSNEQLKTGTANIIYGMDKNGNLVSYPYNNGSTEALRNSNKELFQKIKNDGVLYTFGFRPVLIQNGNVMTNDTSPNIRQAICQVNKNSFIIVTNTNSVNNRNVGFSLKGLADYMKNLNCITAFNMDGGGSTSFYYKKNDKTIQKINTGYDGRNLIDMIYFVEK